MIWKLVRLQLQQPESFRFRTLYTRGVRPGPVRADSLSLPELDPLGTVAGAQRDPMNSVNDLIPAVRERRYKLITDTVANWFYENLAVSNASDYRQAREPLVIHYHIA